MSRDTFGDLGGLDPAKEFAARSMTVDIMEELDTIRQGLDTLFQKLCELEGKQKVIWAELVGSSWSAVGQAIETSRELVQQSVYHTAVLQAILDALLEKRRLTKKDLEKIYKRGTKAVEIFNNTTQPTDDVPEVKKNESKKSSRTTSKTKCKP